MDSGIVADVDSYCFGNWFIYGCKGVMFWYVFFPAVAIVICLCMACAKLEKVCFKETRDFPKDYSDSV